MKRSMTRLGQGVASRLAQGMAAGAVMLAAAAFLASAYAQPVVTGPLSINGRSSSRAGDRRWLADGGGDIYARGPITAAWIERILAANPPRAGSGETTRSVAR